EIIKSLLENRGVSRGWTQEIKTRSFAKDGCTRYEDFQSCYSTESMWHYRPSSERIRPLTGAPHEADFPFGNRWCQMVLAKFCKVNSAILLKGWPTGNSGRVGAFKQTCPCRLCHAEIIQVCLRRRMKGFGAAWNAKIVVRPSRSRVKAATRARGRALQAC